MSEIYYISEEDLNNPDIVEHIQTSDTSHFYWSTDWSPGFYTRLAYEGLISITYKTDQGGWVLLPEMQRKYAVLDWKDLHISRHVKRLLPRKNLYSFRINHNPEGLIKNIQNYHTECWLNDQYAAILKSLNSSALNSVCRVFTTELYDQTDCLVAGEVGYRIGNIYTSLSGFVLRDRKYSNWGIMQMVLLCRYLQAEGYCFWNLGHPYMEYKTRLGAKILNREEFLKRWKAERDG